VEIEKINKNSQYSLQFSTKDRIEKAWGKHKVFIEKFTKDYLEFERRNPKFKNYNCPKVSKDESANPDAYLKSKRYEWLREWMRAYLDYFKNNKKR